MRFSTHMRVVRLVPPTVHSLEGAARFPTCEVNRNKAYWLEKEFEKNRVEEAGLGPQSGRRTRLDQ